MMFLKNKKGAGFTIGKIMGIVIVLALLAVVYVVFFSKDGKLQEAGNQTMEVIDTFTPNITAGTEGLRAEKPVMLEEDGEKKLNNLVKTIRKMLNSTEKNCFQDYGGMPEFDEEKGSTVIFEHTGDGTMMTVNVMGGKQQLKTEKIMKMIPCVIAGSSDITNNFEDSFLDDDESWAEKTIKSGHYKSVTGVKIDYDDGNSIDVTEGGWDDDIVNDEDPNLQDAGFLYTPDNQHICFFPTIYGDYDCDGGDKDGLDNDCLGEDPDESESIPKQVDEGKLKQCY
tara:strand:- start:484 stop:1329 length:846 start_codon:yes stop_codon:yes gene_type:complete